MLTGIHYIEVYIFYCVRYNVNEDFIKSRFGSIHFIVRNFGQAQENCSLHRGLCYIKVREIEVPLYLYYGYFRIVEITQHNADTTSK